MRSAKERKHRSIELRITSSQFNCELMRPNRHSSTVIKLLNTTQHREEIIRTNAMKLFMENLQEIYLTVMGKRLNLRCQVMNNCIGDSSLRFYQGSLNKRRGQRSVTDSSI